MLNKLGVSYVSVHKLTKQFCSVPHQPTTANLLQFTVKQLICTCEYRQWYCPITIQGYHVTYIQPITTTHEIWAQLNYFPLYCNVQEG